MGSRKRTLGTNISRLAQVTTVLVALITITYFFQDFLPVFRQIVAKTCSVLMPFIIALLLAFLLEPVVMGLMRNLRIKRTLAAILTLILVFLGLGLFIFVIVARLYTELSDLAVNLPNFEYVAGFLTSQVDTLEKFITLNPNIQSTLFAALDSIANSLQEWAKSGSVFLLSVLASLPSFFILLVVSLVATFMMSISYPKVKQFIAGLFPSRWHLNAQMISEGLGVAIVGYLRAQAILMSITAVSTIIGLLIIGNRYAVTFGILAGLFEIVPVVGTGLLFVPWIAGLVLMGSFGEAVKLAVMWVITVVMRQMLEPKILSSGIGIHPLATLISMYVGLQLLGVVGVIVGPALVICYDALRKAGVLPWPRG